MQKFKKYQNRKRGECKKAKLGCGGWSTVFHQRSIDSLKHKKIEKNKTPNLILPKIKEIKTNTKIQKNAKTEKGGK